MAFNPGDKVRYKIKPDVTMIVIDFAVEWENNQYNLVNKVKNPEYPICKYYNDRYSKWEQTTCRAIELELAD